jgi:hypothetical protein
MTERLRNNERIREIFGKYIDPRVAQDLLDQPAVVATQGQRRVMTVMFCDMKGFTALSEGMTPQGLVKVMNRYLSTMSSRSGRSEASSTNISATPSWPIGDRHLSTKPMRRASPASPLLR